MTEVLIHLKERRSINSLSTVGLNDLGNKEIVINGFYICWDIGVGYM